MRHATAMSARGSEPVGPLSAQGVSKNFGGVAALSEVTLNAPVGTVTGLIGPNGAGKSTLLGVLSGFIRADSGKVTFDGRDLTRCTPLASARAGIIRTFQAAAPLRGLSAFDNVLVGLHGAYRNAARGARLMPWRRIEADRHLRARASELLNQVGLYERRDHDAGDLTFGQLRFLEIVRAVAAEPVILLLDEPAAGLDATEVATLANLIRHLVEGGVGVVLVDHDVPFVLELAAEIVVMNFGKVIATGPAAEIQHDEGVRNAYLRTDEAVA